MNFFIVTDLMIQRNVKLLICLTLLDELPPIIDERLIIPTKLFIDNYNLFIG